jgi:hypothetical protein
VTNLPLELLFKQKMAKKVREEMIKAGMKVDDDPTAPPISLSTPGALNTTS